MATENGRGAKRSRVMGNLRANVKPDSVIAPYHPPEVEKF